MHHIAFGPYLGAVVAGTVLPRPMLAMAGRTTAERTPSKHVTCTLAHRVRPAHHGVGARHVVVVVVLGRHDATGHVCEKCYQQYCSRQFFLHILHVVVVFCLALGTSYRFTGNLPNGNVHSPRHDNADSPGGRDGNDNRVRSKNNTHNCGSCGRALRMDTPPSSP